MRKEHWYWIAGGVIFIAIVCLWVWQLPNIIADARSGRSDPGLAAIMSSFGQTGEDMTKTQAQLDADLKKYGQALDASGVQAAAISDLKDKINAKAQKDIQSASLPTANSNLNAPHAR